MPESQATMLLALTRGTQSVAPQGGTSLAESVVIATDRSGRLGGRFDTDPLGATIDLRLAEAPGPAVT
jgi:hypothetical protein